MNTLVAKEIRQLRPALAAAVLLAVVPIWFCESDWNSNYRVDDLLTTTGPLFCFGLLLLALTSFGREFGMGTFPLLLALPVTRPRIWWTKIGVLASTLVIVFAAGVCSVFVWYANNSDHLAWQDPKDPHLHHAAAVIVLAFVVTAASGLWTTLLLRQMVAAFWFALLVPLTILTIILWNGGSALAVEIALGIYSAAGFGLAWIQFNRAQEVAWTGGEVNLPEWRSASAVKTATGRAYRPLAALIGKELQLYKVPFVGMAGLFVLHLGVILLRRTVFHDEERVLLATALAEFGGLWMLVPLVTGALNIADERRMGTLEAHLCLPVSQRVQFFVKLFATLFFSGLLSALLLYTAESIGEWLHAGPGFLGVKTALDRTGPGVLTLIFLGLSLAIFYASTLARNVLQAIVMALGIGFALMFLLAAGDGIGWNQYILLWSPDLFNFITWPLLVATVLRLAYSNFRRLSEVRRLWLRNVRGLAGVFLISAVMSAIIYNRVWEYLTPLEPQHGAAKINPAESPRLRYDWGSVSVAFADGRLWSKRIGYQEPNLWEPFGENYPIPLGRGRWVIPEGDQFLEGAKWIAQAHIYREQAGIRSDGSLWLTERPQPAFHHENGQLVANQPEPMVRFGESNDWKDAVRFGENSLLLLKSDGTLWLWGAKYSKDFAGLATVQPARLGSDSDWARFFEAPIGLLIWKTDGHAWEITDVSHKRGAAQIVLAPDLAALRKPLFDNMKLRSFAVSQLSWLIVREDGTLWSRDLATTYNQDDEARQDPDTQIGTETNWVSVGCDSDKLVALKNDGTLWKWDTYWRRWPSPSPFSKPPVRLGTHDDWVALNGHNGVCALAADGSVWLWSRGYDSSVWMAATRKPLKLDNIFSR